MEKRLGNIFGFTGGNYAGNVYDQNYIAPTLNTMQGGVQAAYDNRSTSHTNG
jgi:hypothetical protein